MAEAVILSAIEVLDSRLLKKGYIIKENIEKLYSLIVGISDLEEEKKEMVHSLLFKIYWEDRKKLYNLLDLNKGKMYSLVVGMADFWEDCMRRIYSLMFRVAVGENKNELEEGKLQSLVNEIVDMWEVDEGELNKEKLQNLFIQMQNINSMEKIMSIMGVEVAGLWKDKQPKLNKEKLYTWLDNKVADCEAEYLFCVLLDIIFYDDSSYFLEGVAEAKRELGEMLDLIRDKKLGEENSLRYFISDVVDMAQRAHFLIYLRDSTPFAIFLDLRQKYYGVHTYYHEWFDRKLKRIVNVLQEIKVSMLGFRAERLQDVRDMECDKNVVGLEEDVKLLLHGEGNSKPLVIIRGMVGIGKTTLARQVYNHPTITQQFECRAWVCLSKVFSRKEMLVSLVRQMVDNSELEKIEHADYESLQQVLRQRLLGMRYFIVLDDVTYDTTHLKYVTKALPKAYRQESRMLFTTRDVRDRDEEVYYHYMKSMDMRDEGVYYHHMKSMDGDQSWTLLLKTLSIEGSNEEFPKLLVKQARQILTRCGGLPLAIKEVGRNWAKKRQSGGEWEELVQSIDLTKTLEEMETAYHDWDPELQSLFLHLAFFKEGTTIRAKRLIHIWTVMGVVSDNTIKEDLDKLVVESIIDIDKNMKGNIKTCCAHAVFHMLSIKKAEEELNLEIVHKDGSNRRPCHRVIYCSREKLMSYSSNQDKNLVSLFFYGGGYFNASPSYWNHFEQLETLDMEDFGLEILPEVIGMLSALRYLGLRNNYIQELPHSLSRLKKLEVLDIALNFMVEVKDVIWEMENLCHLYMSDISCRKPLRLDALKNLKTCTYISVHNWEYKASQLEMMSLTKLGIQEVCGNTDVSKLFASLAELNNLEYLIIKGFRFKSMPSLDEIGVLQFLNELKLDGLITRLPSAKNFPQGIMKLTLVSSCLREDPMPILENLPCLWYLKLQNAYSGQQMVISRNGFSRLLFLIIEELWHLTNMQIEEGGMKLLRYLEINSCPKLKTLPENYRSNYGNMEFKMKSTKKNATKIQKSSFISKIRKVDIQVRSVLSV